MGFGSTLLIAPVVSVAVVVAAADDDDDDDKRSASVDNLQSSVESDGRRQNRRLRKHR